MNKNLSILSDTELSNVSGGAISNAECAVGMVVCAAVGTLTSLLCYYSAKQAHKMTFKGNDYQYVSFRHEPDVIIYHY